MQSLLGEIRVPLKRLRRRLTVESKRVLVLVFILRGESLYHNAFVVVVVISIHFSKS